MKEESTNKIKLGLFILTGTVLLVLGLYYIGSQKNIFHRTITVNACFNNVNGLVPGNNVRFNGINVGTVSGLVNVSDTLVQVDFSVDEKLAALIGENAVVSVGTDGLLGNKLLEITPSTIKGQQIKEGSRLQSLNPLQMENTLRSLSRTSSNLETITGNLKEFSGGIMKKNSLWKLLEDTSLSGTVKTALVNFRLTGDHAVDITSDLRVISSGIRNGRGSIGALVSDTLLASRLRQTVVKFERLNDTAAVIAADVSYLLKGLRQGKGSLGVLLKDSMVVHNLNTGILRIDTAAMNFNDNMKSLKRRWPFKKSSGKK
jgi:phospholipid/cholesterol/gamma-HCH transport system substrate-binding protein